LPLSLSEVIVGNPENEWTGPDAIVDKKQKA